MASGCIWGVTGLRGLTVPTRKRSPSGRQLGPHRRQNSLYPPERQGASENVTPRPVDRNRTETGSGVSVRKARKKRVERSGPLRFSRLAHSATLAPLRAVFSRGHLDLRPIAEGTDDNRLSQARPERRDVKVHAITGETSCQLPSHLHRNGQRRRKVRGKVHCLVAYADLALAE